MHVTAYHKVFQIKCKTYTETHMYTNIISKVYILYMCVKLVNAETTKMIWLNVKTARRQQYLVYIQSFPMPHFNTT